MSEQPIAGLAIGREAHTWDPARQRSQQAQECA